MILVDFTYNFTTHYSPLLPYYTHLHLLHSHIHTQYFNEDSMEGFAVADVFLDVGQTRQNLQWMYGKNRDFSAR